MVKISLIKFNIDLRRVNDYIEGDHEEKIKKYLKKVGLLSDDFLYSVINRVFSKEVERTGRPMPPQQNVFYAFTEDQLVWDNNNPNCLKICARQHLNSDLVVIDKRFVQSAYLSNSKFGYEFNDRSKAHEALKGIARLVMPKA